MKCPAFTYFEGQASGSYSVLVVGNDGSAATSGQGTTCPVTGKRITDPNQIEAQVARIIANGREALAKGGLSLAEVAHVGIFHVKHADRPKILAALAPSLGSFAHEFLDASALPGGQHVEIEFSTRGFQALLDAGTLCRQTFRSDETDPVAAASRILGDIRESLRSRRLDMGAIVQARITLPQGMLARLAEVNAVYAGFFSERYPIRSSAAGLDHNTSIEITFPGGLV